MSRTVRKYLVRDKRNKYKRIERLKLQDAYYTDVAKSHDRKVNKKDTSEGSEDSST